jgi:tetratricopeptide (TPR) repeat protein
VSSKRPAILMGVLLLALAGYFIEQRSGPPARAAAPVVAPLPGKNSISNLKVIQDAMGAWKAEFDYFYTGEPYPPLVLIELAPRQLPPGVRETPLGIPYRATLVPRAERGSHHVIIALVHPGIEQTTQTVKVTFSRGVHRDEFATQQIEQVIDWPTLQSYLLREAMSNSTPEENLLRAQQLIDSEDSDALIQARNILEKLLQQNSRLTGAYCELARVAMRTDGNGPDGLHQAETLLNSALEVNPDDADSKILLGYVYTHQHRFAEGEKLYAQAAAQNPPNPWLWVNWGEQLAMQRKTDAAIARYREALAQPKRSDSHDRGRKYAYRQLLELLKQKNDLDAMEVVFKQQVADYGPGSCYSTEYARFLLQVRGDTQGAIDLSKRALNRDCNDAPAREVLGLAQYVKWADTSGPERNEALHDARIYLPTGATALYELATNDRTVRAAKQLIAAGELIDRKDNTGRTALSIALENRDVAAARRLLVLHARADTPIGFEEVPLALIPVLEQNLPAIRLLREFGVNYSTLKYRGHTAIEFAKQSQNPELLEALGGGGASL